MPLMKNALKALLKNILIPLRLTAAALGTDAAIHKKISGSVRPSNLVLRTKTLTISNEEMNNVMKIVKSLEESGLIVKGVSKTIKNEAKEQKVEFFSILLGPLSASLLRNLLTDKRVLRACEGRIRAGQDF